MKVKYNINQRKQRTGGKYWIWKNVIVVIKILMNLLNFRKDIAEECIGCITDLEDIWKLQSIKKVDKKFERNLSCKFWGEQMSDFEMYIQLNYHLNTSTKEL